MKSSSAPFTVEQAVAVAEAAHDGQVDKAGAPYIEHPLRVMAGFGAELLRMVAVLHDVVEDAADRGFSLPDLAEQGVPREALDAIEALTHRDGEGNGAYWARVAANPIARAVKLADIADNADPVRLARLAPEERERLAEKYRRAREVLVSDLHTGRVGSSRLGGSTEDLPLDA